MIKLSAKLPIASTLPDSMKYISDELSRIKIWHDGDAPEEGAIT